MSQIYTSWIEISGYLLVYLATGYFSRLFRVEAKKKKILKPKSGKRDQGNLYSRLRS